jgi:hypothetical protein
METLKGELASFESVKDLKPLLSSRGPCLSVYMPLSTSGSSSLQNAKQNEVRWKECVRSIEPKVAQHGVDGRELLNSIASWDAVVQSQPLQGKSIALFRSPNVFLRAWMDDEVNRVEVGPHFYIRPLLPELTRARTFYLLALSQKNVRLLRCTSRTSEEVFFPAEVKTNYDAWMNLAKPDHADVYNAVAGASGGSSRGALAPMGAGKEAKDEDLSHFFRQIDRGVNEVLRGRSEPLVLCAVDSQLPLYREVNSYPHLAEEVVRGAPDGLKGGEMHGRALDALQKTYDREVDEALTEWDHRVGGGASSRLKEVITAAHDGRVLTLLVSDSLEKTGVFNEATHSVKGRETGGSNDVDLVNDAALQAILHAGKVLVVPHNKMPNGSAVAATFRF